jgi:hypothetical protein
MRPFSPSKLGFKTFRLMLLPFSKARFVNCKNLHIPCCEACHLKRTSEESSCLIPPHVSKYSSKANFCYKLSPFQKKKSSFSGLSVIFALKMFSTRHSNYLRPMLKQQLNFTSSCQKILQEWCLHLYLVFFSIIHASSLSTWTSVTFLVSPRI